MTNQEGKLVKYACTCGFESDELKVGSGRGGAFRLVESAVHSCSECRTLMYRFSLKEGIGPEAVEEAVSLFHDDGAFRPLTTRALLGLAEEGRAGGFACPLCMQSNLVHHDDKVVPCPECGTQTEISECGTWK